MAAKEKIISIKPKGITPKQYSALLLEINLMKRAWKPYGVDLQVSAPGLRNILKWGTNAYARISGTRRWKKTMDLILLNDGMYQLVSVTKQMMEGIELLSEVDCLDLCDILRLHLTTYHEPWNVHVMNDGTGDFYGCICK